MNAAWPRHRPECDNVVVATQYFEEIGAPEGPGIPCMITAEDIFRLSARSVAVYHKYGVDDLPDANSTMEVNTKYALFLAVLRENDTCTAVNRSRPLPEKLMLNKYYNGMYTQAKEIFSPSRFAQLEAQIKEDHAGYATRSS